MSLWSASNVIFRAVSSMFSLAWERMTSLHFTKSRSWALAVAAFTSLCSDQGVLIFFQTRIATKIITIVAPNRPKSHVKMKTQDEKANIWKMERYTRTRFASYSPTVISPRSQARIKNKVNPLRMEVMSSIVLYLEQLQYFSTDAILVYIKSLAS